MFIRISVVLLTLSGLLAACAPQAAPTVLSPPSTAAVSAPPVSPTAEPSALPEPTASSGVWVPYRDARYGIGLAYPCWWVFHPMPAEGAGGAISLRSFDEDYFRAHSVKGQWKDGVPPEGVFTADFVVFEQVDPAKSNAEAYPVDPSMNAIVSSEEMQIGRNPATLIRLKDVNNGNAPLTPVLLFRLAPDKLLAFVTQQPDRLDSPDLQGILTSLSLSPDQPIVVPTVQPHSPLISAECPSK